MMITMYRWFGYFGLGSIYATLLYGFRHSPDAPWINVPLNLCLFAVFGLPHLIATRTWFKKAVWGSPSGSSPERRVYVSVSIIVWVLMFALHWPLPGPGWAAPGWLRFIGLSGFVVSMMALFQGVTFELVDGLFAVPGSAMSHSHGSETPLMTEGAYARVRHPMYRAAMFACLSSLFIYPNIAQLFWCVLIAGTFVVFIPIEERQLIESRGDAYRNYMRQTPYRLLRGIW